MSIPAEHKEKYSLILSKIAHAIPYAFSVQAQSNVQLGQLIENSASFPNIQADVSAIIGIGSSQWTGTVGLSFPKKTFLSLVNRMLGENYQEITAENADAAGEFLNIVYGTARPQINGMGEDFKPAIPSVVRGQNMEPLFHSAMITTLIKCTSPDGDFYAALSLKKTEG